MASNDPDTYLVIKATTPEDLAHDINHYADYGYAVTPIHFLSGGHFVVIMELPDYDESTQERVEAARAAEEEEIRAQAKAQADAAVEQARRGVPRMAPPPPQAPSAPPAPMAPVMQPPGQASTRAPGGPVPPPPPPPGQLINSNDPRNNVVGPKTGSGPEVEAHLASLNRG